MTYRIPKGATERERLIFVRSTLLNVKDLLASGLQEEAGKYLDLAIRAAELPPKPEPASLPPAKLRA